MKMNASAEPEKQSQYKANSNPIPERPKMNENLFATKVYENITTFGLRQNKPKQTQLVAAWPPASLAHLRPTRTVDRQYRRITMSKTFLQGRICCFFP